MQELKQRVFIREMPGNTPPISKHRSESRVFLYSLFKNCCCFQCLFVFVSVFVCFIGCLCLFYWLFLFVSLGFCVSFIGCLCLFHWMFVFVSLLVYALVKLRLCFMGAGECVLCANKVVCADMLCV